MLVSAEKGGRCMTKEEYTPRSDVAEWLSWVLEKVNELPYKATARWAFYRLVQERGFAKDDYKRFLKITSRARKGFWNGWDPDTFTDDTRVPINFYGLGYKNAATWFDSMADTRPELECEKDQENIVFVAFEAKAMVRQFKYYLDEWRVCMLPFGGDASIPYKYQIAGLIDEAAERWPGKDIYVLYFGDYDPKGLEIPENAMRDIRRWTNADVEFKYQRL
jgi:hypothetical protein